MSEAITHPGSPWDSAPRGKDRFTDEQRTALTRVVRKVWRQDPTDSIVDARYELAHAAQRAASVIRNGDLRARVRDGEPYSTFGHLGTPIRGESIAVAAVDLVIAVERIVAWLDNPSLRALDVIHDVEGGNLPADVLARLHAATSAAVEVHDA